MLGLEGRGAVDGGSKDRMDLKVVSGKNCSSEVGGIREAGS